MCLAFIQILEKFDESLYCLQSCLYIWTVQSGHFLFMIRFYSIQRFSLISVFDFISRFCSIQCFRLIRVFVFVSRCCNFNVSVWSGFLISSVDSAISNVSVWSGSLFSSVDTSYIRHLSYCFCVAVNWICIAISRVDGALKAWSALHLEVGNPKQKPAYLDLPVPVM